MDTCHLLLPVWAQLNVQAGRKWQPRTVTETIREALSENINGPVPVGIAPPPSQDQPFAAAGTGALSCTVHHTAATTGRKHASEQLFHQDAERCDRDRHVRLTFCGNFAGSQLDLVDGLFTSLPSTRAGSFSLGPVTSKGVPMQASTFPCFPDDSCSRVCVCDIPAWIIWISVSNLDLLRTLLFCAGDLSSAFWSRLSDVGHAR